MAATYQRLSGARLLLNVVTGGQADEQRRFGDHLSHDERYARTGEFLEIVRGAWGGQPLDFTGQYYQVEGATVLRPPDPVPGIYFGGSSAAAGPVAASFADVYLTWGEPPAQVAAKLAWVRELAAAPVRLPAPARGLLVRRGRAARDPPPRGRRRQLRAVPARQRLNGGHSTWPAADGNCTSADAPDDPPSRKAGPVTVTDPARAVPHARPAPPVDAGTFRRALARHAAGVVIVTLPGPAALATRPQQWETVVDALRPLVPSLWQRMPDRDKQLFLRHVARYWEVHRHRMPPATAQRITALRCARRMTVVTEKGGQLRVRVDRDGAVTELRAGWLINATGPGPDISRSADPLLRDLLIRGQARPDPLRPGLEASPGGALLDASGVPSGDLFTLGPPLRGMRYETTAIPEIRDQAAALARHLTSAIQGRRHPGSAA